MKSNYTINIAPGIVAHVTREYIIRNACERKLAEIRARIEERDWQETMERLFPERWWWSDD